MSHTDSNFTTISPTQGSAAYNYTQKGHRNSYSDVGTHGFESPQLQNCSISRTKGRVRKKNEWPAAADTTAARRCIL